MEISFHHTNVAAGHESTLLKIAPNDGDVLWYLIDAGESVSPSAFLGTDTALDGVFLTHAHTDHYESLSQVLSSDSETPLFTSPPTAAIIQQVYTEADRHRGLGDVSQITDALNSIDAWTELNDWVDVLPIPAGHTPGAAAFLFRIDDLKRNDEIITILATGDFTVRPVAGYPGLVIPDSIDIDIVVANAATSENVPETLADAIETILERTLGGSTTLVAANALTSVHIAYLLGHVAAELERKLPIHLVGQGAKLFELLKYDVPHVSPHPEFEQTDEVLVPGTVTIAGPEAPTDGSTARLFETISEQPDAVFVQLTTSGSDSVGGVTCATYDFELSNHPSKDRFLEFVRENFPRHLVLKHIRPEAGKSLGSSFDKLFFWANDDTREHVLYDDGDWLGPPWLSDGSETRINMRNFRHGDPRRLLDGPVEQLPTTSWERGTPDLKSEGAAVDTFVAQFKETSVPGNTHQEVTASNDEDATQTGESSSEAEAMSQARNNDETITDDQQHAQVDEQFQRDIREHLETLESTVTALAESVATQEEVGSSIDAIETKVNEIETEVNRLPEKLTDDHPSVPAYVIQQGELLLFRADLETVEEDVLQTVEHGQQVEISITHSEGTRLDNP